MKLICTIKWKYTLWYRIVNDKLDSLASFCHFFSCFFKSLLLLSFFFFFGLLLFFSWFLFFSGSFSCAGVTVTAASRVMLRTGVIEWITTCLDAKVWNTRIVVPTYWKTALFFLSSSNPKKVNGAMNTNINNKKFKLVPLRNQPMQAFACKQECV